MALTDQQKRLAEVRKGLEAIPTDRPFSVYDLFPGLQPALSMTNKRLLDRLVEEGVLQAAQKPGHGKRGKRNFWRLLPGQDEALINILADDVSLGEWLWGVKWGPEPMDNWVPQPEAPEPPEGEDDPWADEPPPAQRAPTQSAPVVEQYLGTIVQVLEGISDRLSKLEATNAKHLEAASGFTNELAEAVQTDETQRINLAKTLENLVEGLNTMRSEFRDYQRKNSEDKPPRYAAVHLHEVKSEVSVLRGDIERMDKGVVIVRKQLESLPALQVEIDKHTKALGEMATLVLTTKQTVQNTAWNDLVNRQSSLMEELANTRKAIERVPGINDGRQQKLDKIVTDLTKLEKELGNAAGVFFKAVGKMIDMMQIDLEYKAGGSALAIVAAGGGALGPKKSG